MSSGARLIDRIKSSDIVNPYLKSLVARLKNNEDNILGITPQTAQIFKRDYNCKGHTDHTDYQEHQDTSPPHSDYCD